MTPSAALPAWAWLAVPGVPFLAALAIPLLRLRRFGWAPLAALPAVLLALGGPCEGTVHVPWLFNGARLGLDTLGAAFLFFTSIVWLFALLFAVGYVHERRPAFFAFSLLALAGNLGLIVAQDTISYYAFFALMGFSSYPLVIHDRTESARYAGKVYIVLVLVGEVLIFSGLCALAAITGHREFSAFGADWLAHPLARPILAALVLGFGIKAGALPLHVWLPLAHPAAPTPASAVLSGAMIKAGLLGWLRFLPLGSAALPDGGNLLLLAGFAAALGAALYGIFQSHPKTILAYSSISKMGLMTAMVGMALRQPADASWLLPLIALYATHHAFCKSALFLSTGLPTRAAAPWGQALRDAALVLPALALAGFAGTSGAAAKVALKKTLAAGPALLPEPLVPWLLLAASFAAALLLFRFLWVHYRAPHSAHPAPGVTSHAAWSASVLLVALLPVVLFLRGSVASVHKGLALSAAPGAAAPVALALAAGLAAALLARRNLPLLPAGDLLMPYVRLVRLARNALSAGWSAALRLTPQQTVRRVRIALGRSVRFEDLRAWEGVLGRAPVFGLLFLALFVVFFAILLRLGGG